MEPKTRPKQLDLQFIKARELVYEIAIEKKDELPFASNILKIKN